MAQNLHSAMSLAMETDRVGKIPTCRSDGLKREEANLAVKDVFKRFKRLKSILTFARGLCRAGNVLLR